MTLLLTGSAGEARLFLKIALTYLEFLSLLSKWDFFSASL
jgi:hypothetical protein